MRFRRYLIERRSNPEKNPKRDRTELLEPYKNDPDVFISFTVVDKIGINPQSGYNTPNGIYTYPLKEMWRAVETNRIPFGGDRPNIYVLKRTTNKVLDLAKYSHHDYDKDFFKLYDAIPKMFNRWLDVGNLMDVGSSIQFDKDYVKSLDLLDIFDLWKVMMVAYHADFKFVKSFNVLRDILIDNPKLNDLYDKLLITDTSNVYTTYNVYRKLIETVFKSSDYSTQEKDYLKGILKGFRSIILAYKLDIRIQLRLENTPKKELKIDRKKLIKELDVYIIKEIVDDHVHKYSFNSHNKAASMLWYLTMELATNANNWNYILRKILGYELVTDKKGYGIIHSSEPLQAVFLTKSAFSTIDKVVNRKKIAHKQIYSSQERFDWAVNNYYCNKEIKRIGDQNVKLYTLKFKENEELEIYTGTQIRIELSKDDRNDKSFWAITTEKERKRNRKVFKLIETKNNNYLVSDYTIFHPNFHPHTFIGLLIDYILKDKIDGIMYPGLWFNGANAKEEKTLLKGLKKKSKSAYSIQTTTQGKKFINYYEF